MSHSKYSAHKHRDREPLPFRLALEQLLFPLWLITTLAQVLPELMRQKAGTEKDSMLPIFLAHMIYGLVDL